MSKALSQRPSDLLNIPPTLANDVLRFELDQAVSGLGVYVDSKLEEVDDKGKRKYGSASEVLLLAKPRDAKPKTAKELGAKPASTLKRNPRKRKEQAHGE